MGKSIDKEEIDKRGDKSYVRMGKSVEMLDNEKRQDKSYVRLGRNFNAEDKRASSKQYVRFGRNSNNAISSDQLNELRRLDGINLDNSHLKEVEKKARQYVRFG